MGVAVSFEVLSSVTAFVAGGALFLAFFLTILSYVALFFHNGNTSGTFPPHLLWELYFPPWWSLGMSSRSWSVACTSASNTCPRQFVEGYLVIWIISSFSSWPLSSIATNQPCSSRERYFWFEFCFSSSRGTVATSLYFRAVRWKIPGPFLSFRILLPPWHIYCQGWGIWFGTIIVLDNFL